jgi:hypothetical protein
MLLQGDVTNSGTAGAELGTTLLKSSVAFC